MCITLTNRLLNNYAIMSGTRFCVNRPFLVLLLFNLFYTQCQTQNLTDNKNTTTPSHDTTTNQPSTTKTQSLETNLPIKTNHNATYDLYNEPKIDQLDTPEQQEIDNAVLYGLEEMYKLYYVDEPKLYKMGLFLDSNHPAHALASFRTQKETSQDYARYGYAALQASSKIAQKHAEIKSREAPLSITLLRSNLLSEKCPLRGTPRCSRGFERYRTADGTCNNLQNPWNGAAMLPMQRLLPPQYDDGIQSIRQSVLGGSLPSARSVSAKIHQDRDVETNTLTLMFMQWGQFLGHDLVFSAQARMFNRSVPRCCQKNGNGLLPDKLTHPECLPIEIPENDRFYSKFDVRCMEFVRSAPTSRIDCNLGWREQISQVTAYIDGSMIYGSDAETSDLLRLFKRGQIAYGRPKDQGPLQPPDPPEGELCKLGAITTDCFQSGDFRVGDQPGLTALHMVWIRYHNLIALQLGRLNQHWSDEKIYQETRKIVAAVIQHITYKEFLPIVLGQEVMKLFNLTLLPKGFYKDYNPSINPAPANAFGGAAFRFGHSLVQPSLIRADSSHNLISNNVSLHEEQENVENIWSLGSLDRLILGLCNQPSQKRDEFISGELTNHLFQRSRFPFGMDLAAINIQRGRDHGLPSYTTWRQPCGLTPIKKWSDLEKVMSLETVNRFKSIYGHFDDIDLFSGGLAERPVRGGIVGPTFACIIAQQFSNLRQGDRFWYENGNFESSFTPAQLQQIRQVTFAHVLCKTLPEIKTLQIFVFLVSDNLRNSRWSCDSLLGNFKLSAWVENVVKERRFDVTNDDVQESRVGGDDMELRDEPEAGEFQESRLEETKLLETTTVNTHHEELQESRVEGSNVEARRRRTTTRPTTKKTKKPVKTQTRPFKVKLTNVTTSVINKNKYTTRRTTRRPQTVTIGHKPISVMNSNKISGYLVNYSTQQAEPNRTPQLLQQMQQYQVQTQQGPSDNPYSLNINIQFVPVSSSQDNNKHEEVVNIKPSTAHPIYTYDQYLQRKPPYSTYEKPNYPSYQQRPKSPTRKPYQPTGQPHQPTRQPHQPTRQPHQPTRQPHQPNYDFQIPSYPMYNQNSYSTYGPNKQYHNPSFSTYVPNKDYYQTYNNEQASYSTMDFVTKRPSFTVETNFGSYSHPTYRPTFQSTTTYRPLFENLPFATSGRPPFYATVSTAKPVIIPSYLFLNDQNDSENFKDFPNPNYEQQLGETDPDKPDHDQDKPDHDQDKPDHNQDKNHPNTETPADKKYIKISSIQGQKYVANKEPVLLTLHQREGDLELSEAETTTIPPLVQVDIIPIRTGEWKIYNATNDQPIPSILDIIDFNSTLCTDELPRPINSQS